ncbi:LysR family transcriptional regulator [Burkholderia ambifaria]|jgi:DNA-binding transcriptional LysR family regulator|uniref:Transcriptional regulator, LysR family n=1 Tax=Burkholderia ambifaria IOP40-10 TaxID=396596 RepID=B1F8Z9_9BURK|nr:LysR family transcriptional regulator [Burkholderia ambifaria]EDT05921.1 transcriptional regulator, LysR family [Burkholderia ambifaria IOP40-10]
MRNLDILTAMRVFVRVVECGSISEAARGLGMGQSTVSERLDRLERHLGLPLLFRHARRLACTDDGQVFYERSKTAIELTEIALGVGRERHDVRGIFKLAAPQAFGEIVLPGIVVEIRKQYPELSVELFLEDAVVDPATAGVDLSLRLERPGGAPPDSYYLGHVHRTLVASPAYLGQHAPISEPSALTDHPFIRARGIYNARAIELIGADSAMVQVPINVAFSVNHWRPAREQLIAGFGIGILEPRVCAEAIADGRLQRILPEYNVPGLDLYAVLPVARPTPPKTRAILSIIEECLPRQLEQARP